MLRKKRYRSIFKVINENVNSYVEDADDDDAPLDEGGNCSAYSSITSGKRFKVSISPTQQQRQRLNFPQLKISQHYQSPKNCSSAQIGKTTKTKENIIKDFNVSLNGFIESYCDDFPSSGESDSAINISPSPSISREAVPSTDDDSAADTFGFYKTWNEFLSLSGPMDGPLNDSNSINKSTICRDTNFERCRKNGYLKELKRAMDATIRDTKFIKHDKRLGLREGIRMTVLSIEEDFGTRLAEVRLKDNSDFGIKDLNVTFHIALDEDQAKVIKLNAELEGFFDDNYYVLQEGTDSEKIVYVQPQYLFIVS